MKRFLTIMAIASAFAMVASSLLAYQEAFNVTGHRTQSRNAVVGSVDAAYYNPAGLVGLEDGLYVDLGNRVLGLNTTSEFQATGNETDSQSITWLLPNLATVYKEGKGSVYFAMDIRDGGAGGYWDDATSLALLDATAFAAAPFAGTVASADSVDLTTYTFGYTVGGAFELNKMVTVSAGLRYLKKIQDLVIKSPAGGAIDDIESHASWDGYQAIAGLLLTPMDELNVSIQYAGRSTMLATTQDAYNSDPADIAPSVLYLGAGYKVMPELEVMLSYTEEFTHAGSKGWQQANDFPYDDGDTNKRVIGLGAEYAVMQGLLVSGGLAYKMTGTGERNNVNPLNPSFDEIDLGIGAKYTVMPGLDVEGGVAYNYYMEMEDENDIWIHNRSSWIIGLGVTYKAL